ncbi:metallophosphoesterase family protein [Mucilaginibacter flavus]|uniref:metallophosphoesterase family protein n=1 Tax=Mucilaginibacter flavus TaxID=931504 RepID=UPI0025B4310C|nr:metallophosphoesterase [Mucilaginibacter flavus]MDN3584270.1 metallophosphoesterase [Mucilaginibacter flavus]
MNSSPLIFAHIGDLHITKAKEQNYIDLLSIVAQIETEISDQLDFVVLPGDNADNGLPEQYKLVAAALKMLSVPVYILAGDHDMEQGSLDNMYQIPLTRQLPLSVLHKDNRCLFIDVCGSGDGGPDFRIGHKQFHWLQNELEAASNAGETILLFMHTFPADLKEPAERQLLNILLEKHAVLLVDMGHTHYNEITNNGQTIFTATRSTGQIEEGPVGYSLTAIHDGVVSWRFKQLADPFPLVMVTGPVDHRLLNRDNQTVRGDQEISAVILGSRKTIKAEYRIGISDWQEMFFSETGNLWKATIQVKDRSINELTVKATDATGRPGIWTIQPPTNDYTQGEFVRDGSDADTIGAWPENGLFGTQLGPNSNGKPS